MKSAAIATTLMTCGCVSPTPSPLRATYLRCEYRIDPLGIDAARPRLSWIVTSEHRGQRQEAYQILVASSREELDDNRGTLWDSGKVKSDETISVVYEGKPLTSLAICHWKVKVWDKDGVASEWSKPAHWQMGLMSNDQWKAKWIGVEERPVYQGLEEQIAVKDDFLKDCRWIWAPGEGDPTVAVPAETRYFRKSFTVEAGRCVDIASLFVAVDNFAKIYLNGTEVKGNINFAHAARLDIKEPLKPGRNVLAVAVENAGTVSNPAGLLGKGLIAFSDQSCQLILIDGSWKCSDTLEDGWKTDIFDDSNWQNVKAFADNGDSPWGEIKISRLELLAPVHLRRAFEVPNPVRRATALVSALGNCRVSINGKAVGEDYFVPGWTDYTRRVYYMQYDVTDHLRPGENAIGGVLADGWYSGHIGWGHKRDHYGRDIRLAVQLHIEYADGRSEVILTDNTWKAQIGPMLYADFLMGEMYDARRELTGWEMPGYDDATWKAVSTGSTVNPTIQAYPGVPVQVFKEIAPVSRTEPKKGVYVFDMGTNLAGVVRLNVQGQPGDTIVLRFAERLNPDGTIYTENLRSARAIDTYICKGGGREIWQPTFTFHGFQYVEVTGYPGVPEKEAITAVELTSATPVAGAFSCSSPMLNQLYHNICQTQRSNFIDIPTDCPQRDERLGWTGDAQVYIRAACYNTDVQAFFTKWLVDLADAQRADGQFPMVAPVKVATDDGGPGWADAGVICPWAIYEMYGDRQLLERHYDGMKRFIAFCKNRSTADLLPPAQFHCFGDWLNIDDDTPKDVIFTSYFAHSTFLTARAAEALDKRQEAAEYDALFGRIKAAFINAYVAPDGKIKGDSQTAYVLALAHDLLDGQRKTQAADHLIRKLRDNNWHLSTGFLGTKDLMHVLSKIGRYDAAYRLLHNDTFPSWGFSIKHGATSIWERWNGWTPEQGFGDPGMNSFAHYAYGAVGQWMFEHIGGINANSPAFKTIRLQPHPDGTLTWANVRYHSIRGPIASHWKHTDGVFAWNIEIPANTTALIYVPTTDTQSITESGKPISQADNIVFEGTRKGFAVLKIGSGTYYFQATLTETEALQQ